MSQAAPDREALAALRAYLGRRPAGGVPAPAHAGDRWHRQRWNELHDRGWSAILLPISEGGAGGTFRELSDLARLIGHTLTGTALVSNAMAQLALSLTTHGGDVWDAAVGDTLDGAQLALVPGVPGVAPGRLTVRRGRLHGCTAGLPDLAVADLLVVMAEDECTGEWGGYLVAAHQPGVSVAPRATGDSTRVFGAVRFNGVPAGPSNALDGGPLPAHPANALLLGLSAILVGADAAGGIQRYLGAGGAAAPRVLADVEEARARLDTAVRSASEVVFRALDTGEFDRVSHEELSLGVSAAAALTSGYLALTDRGPVAAGSGQALHRQRAAMDKALIDDLHAWAGSAPGLSPVG